MWSLSFAGQKADPKLLAWASATPLASFFLSSITMLELELGTLLMGLARNAMRLLQRQRSYVNGVTVATRNAPDFAPTGVQVLNPWADS